MWFSLCDQSIYLTLGELLVLEQMLLRSIMNRKQREESGDG